MRRVGGTRNENPTAAAGQLVLVKPVALIAAASLSASSDALHDAARERILHGLGMSARGGAPPGHTPIGPSSLVAVTDRSSSSIPAT